LAASASNCGPGAMASLYPHDTDSSTIGGGVRSACGTAPPRYNSVCITDTRNCMMPANRLLICWIRARQPTRSARPCSESIASGRGICSGSWRKAAYLPLPGRAKEGVTARPEPPISRKCAEYPESFGISVEARRRMTGCLDRLRLQTAGRRSTKATTPRCLPPSDCHADRSTFFVPRTPCRVLAAGVLHEVRPRPSLRPRSSLLGLTATAWPPTPPQCKAVPGCV